jgi:hypothetical protein
MSYKSDRVTYREDEPMGFGCVGAFRFRTAHTFQQRQPLLRSITAEGGQAGPEIKRFAQFGCGFFCSAAGYLVAPAQDWRSGAGRRHKLYRPQSADHSQRLGASSSSTSDEVDRSNLENPGWPLGSQATATSPCRRADLPHE